MRKSRFKLLSSAAWCLNTGPDQRAVSLRSTTLFSLVPEMTLTISQQMFISGTNVDEYIPGIIAYHNLFGHGSVPDQHSAIPGTNADMRYFRDL